MTFGCAIVAACDTQARISPDARGTRRRTRRSGSGRDPLDPLAALVERASPPEARGAQLLVELVVRQELRPECVRVPAPVDVVLHLAGDERSVTLEAVEAGTDV